MSFWSRLAQRSLDYVFKSQATQAVSHEGSLARVFSIYYAVAGVLAFLVQSFLAPWILRHMGPVGSLGTLPGSVGVLGGALLLVPGFWSVAIVRGLEAVLQNSLYRSGYELLFIPIEASLKRKAKAALDVGMDKLGDSMAAGIILVLLGIAPKSDFRLFLIVAMCTSVMALFVIYRMRKQYISTLGAALEKGASPRSPRRGGTLEKPEHRQSIVGRRYGDAFAGEILPAFEALSREVVRRIGMLLKTHRRKVLNTLENEEFDLEVAVFLVPYLKEDDLRPSIESYLTARAASCTGALVDYLLSENQPAKLRRRIPRLLASADPARATEGLIKALADSDFEVRFRSAIALSGLVDNDVKRAVPPGNRLCSSKAGSRRTRQGMGAECSSPMRTTFRCRCSVRTTESTTTKGFSTFSRSWG